jgi:Transcription factor DP/E2F/DP family winged-helix DNA-binding domain
MTSSNNNNNNKSNDDRKRPAQSPIPTTPSPSKKPKNIPSSFSAKKPMWGLRQFSWRICKIVQERGFTTYAQVADVLCDSSTDNNDHNQDGVHDLVSIRRRVYDSLNVLTGLDIIQKNPSTRTIQWMGFTNNTTVRPAYDLLLAGGGHSAAASTETTIHELRQQIDQCRYRLHEQRQQLKELLTQAFCYRNILLLRRTQQQRDSTSRMGGGRMGGGGPTVPTTTTIPTTTSTTNTVATAAAATISRKVPLPCLLVRTSNECIVRCEMSPDRTIVHFDFSLPFEISDDTTILQQLGLYVSFSSSWMILFSGHSWICPVGQSHTTCTLPLFFRHSSHKTRWHDIQKILPPDLLAYCGNHSLLQGLVVEEQQEDYVMSS